MTTLSKPSEFSCGLMHEVVVTACKAGWTPEHFARLAQSQEKMEQFLSVLNGQGEIKVTDYIVDLNADPFVPNGWKVEGHKKGRKWKFDSKQIKLHLSKNQMNDKVIMGHELHKELVNLPIMNANLLDFYLKHPELIPEEWKGKAVLFWGTIYRRSGGHLYIRYLCWGVDNKWRWDCYRLVFDFDSDDPALVLAS